ncbi:MAG: phytoene desaturase family protein [Mycobacterium sp.]
MTSATTRAACDVIVLGGGDNGLVCASYLARAGAKTVLLAGPGESDVIGNLRTEEFQGPYRFDLLPPYMLTMGERAPCHIDLHLAQQSLAYVTPAVQIAFHHADDRALVFHRDPEKSAAAVARFSAADAQRFLAMYGEFRLLCEEILIPSLYAPDGDTGVAAQFGSTDLGRRLADLSARTPIDIVDDYGFESPAVREALLYLATFWGIDPDAAGIGQVAVLWVYCLLNSSIVRAGNVAAARALYQSFLASGGDSPGNARVDRILVENERASGVRLENGREIRARAVVSTLNAEETFFDLIGANQLPIGMAEACHAWQWQEASMLGCHFGYRGEAPSYRAAAFDPDANEAYLHIFGVEEAGDVEAICETIRAGAIPRGHGRAICATQFDEFHAGFGQVYGPLQTLRFDVPVPVRLTDGEWHDTRAACRQAALDLWRHHAKGVVDGPLSYSGVVTPVDLHQRLPSFKLGSFMGGKYTIDRMGYGGIRSAGSRYRSEIPGLYMGGASTHPAGLIHFAAGYNAAGVIAGDLQLDTWWDEPGSVRAARENGYLPGTPSQGP